MKLLSIGGTQQSFANNVTNICSKQIKHGKTTTLGSCAKKLGWYHG
jgi:hypothetical protein